jgi:hypothetical protein
MLFMPAMRAVFPRSAKSSTASLNQVDLLSCHIAPRSCDNVSNVITRLNIRATSQTSFSVPESGRCLRDVRKCAFEMFWWNLTIRRAIESLWIGVDFLGRNEIKNMILSKHIGTNARLWPRIKNYRSQKLSLFFPNVLWQYGYAQILIQYFKYRHDFGKHGYPRAVICLVQISKLTRCPDTESNCWIGSDT